MPLRPCIPFTPLAPRFQSQLPRQFQFHTSATLHNTAQPTHYEILQIPPNASQAEVKKAFYSLSKTHHPDLNPSDPHAPTRFHALSTAYQTLSSPSLRTTYDSTLPQSQTHHSPRPSGSYSSTTPAGGRPASGLSRRRTQFRGPPESFYRSGGWGSHSAKRASAQNTNSNSGSSSNSTTGAGGAGMGYGQGTAGDDVRHFDRQEHLRTQERHERRRRGARRGDKDTWEGVEGEMKERGWVGEFLAVCGVVVLGVSVPVLWAGRGMG